MVSIVEQALEDNIILISINVDAYDDPIEKPGWEGKVLSYLKQSFYMAPIKFIRKMQEEFICEIKNDLLSN